MREETTVFSRLIGSAILLWMSVMTLDAAVVLDWTEWEPTFIDGRRNWQSFTNSDGVQVRYRNNWVRYDNSTPRASFLFGTPSLENAANGGGGFPPFNGTGGAPDHYLDVYQNAGIGNGSRHRFRFNQGLDGASVAIWDIDSSVSNGRNYTDQVRVTAIDGSGQVLTPTRAIITNTNVVAQTGADTWSSLPDAQAGSNSTDGNLTVFFDAADIREIEVEYINADAGVVSSPDRDSQAIGIYNITETGSVLPPVIPEPGVGALVVSGAVVVLRRRRR